MQIKKRLGMVLIIIGFLSACGSHDPIKRNVFSDKVVESTGAFKATEQVKVEDNIIGFSIDPKKKEILVIAEKYYFITKINARLEYIINTPEVRNNIYLLYREDGGWGSWAYELVNSDGKPNNPPILKDLTLIMCFRDDTPKNILEEQSAILKKQKTNFLIYGTKPCFYAVIGNGDNRVYDITPAVKSVKMTSLKKPFPYILNITMAKDPKKLESQNRKAVLLSPFATVADATFTFGQYLALPFTIWFM